MPEYSEGTSTGPVLHNMRILWEATLAWGHPISLAHPFFFFNKCTAVRASSDPVLPPSLSPVKSTVQKAGSPCLLLPPLHPSDSSLLINLLRLILFRPLLLQGLKLTQVQCPTPQVQVYGSVLAYCLWNHTQTNSCTGSQENLVHLQVK